MTTLAWLPEVTDWSARMRALADPQTPAVWEKAVALANSRLDFIRSLALDEAVRRLALAAPPEGLAGKPVRLAVLGSSTTTHLLPAIRIAGLRRGIFVSTYESGYGQYWQELNDPDSALHTFNPEVVLFALDAHHLAAGVHAHMEEAEAEEALNEVEARIRECWRLGREAFDCPIIHQTPLVAQPRLMGSNEHRLPGSASRFIGALNARLRHMVDHDGAALLAIDDRAAFDGLGAWHDPILWHRSKQEITPIAAPMYGEMVASLIAAMQGRSSKCLVLDLDNTLWGGVIGDDGLDGLALGQGSAVGEAYVAFQAYVRELAQRGVILAVCSKNDEANAVEPFDKHPEMVLKRTDIACFVANWSDKAGNIRKIAEQLNIGLDSLVFVDDNPFERALVRQELPMVAVPEVGDDPTLFPRLIADAGYFESLAITGDDRARNAQYRSNRQREALKCSATDLDSYLRSLEMELVWRPFDSVGLSRTVQLINKTNQFNLTTRRYTEESVLAVMQDPHAFGLQLRLTDRFGDNGVISIIIGRLQDDDDLLIDTWLMSCRVLGRRVEATTLNLVAEQARTLGARRLLGEYIPSAKNAMVKDHYTRLGFSHLSENADGGSLNVLDLSTLTPSSSFIHMRRN